MPPSADSSSEARRAKEGCQLICIPPDKVGLVWPHVRPLILAAMKRGDLGSFKPVEDSVLAGDALIWLACDSGARIAAAAVTELHATEWRKVGVIVACAGRNMPGWLPLIAGIEKYFRAEGCTASRIMGRRGWARVLTTYRIRRVVLEKEL